MEVRFWLVDTRQFLQEGGNAYFVNSFTQSWPGWLTIAFVLEPRSESAFMWPRERSTGCPRSTKVALGPHAFARTAPVFRMEIGAISTVYVSGLVEMGEVFMGEGGTSFLTEGWP